MILPNNNKTFSSLWTHPFVWENREIKRLNETKGHTDKFNEVENTNETDRSLVSGWEWWRSRRADMKSSQRILVHLSRTKRWRWLIDVLLIDGQLSNSRIRRFSWALTIELRKALRINLRTSLDKISISQQFTERCLNVSSLICRRRSLCGWCRLLTRGISFLDRRC